MIGKILIRGGTICLLALATFAAEQRKPSLTGEVIDAHGEPFKGARVFIHTAKPKEGPGILCPSCYPDCTKRVTTDAEGKFKIDNLDPNLLFRVLIVGKEHQPKFIKDVDTEGEPIDVALQLVFGDEDPARRMRGRVTDSKGEAISGAVVNTRGVTRGEGTRFGGNNDIDPLAVSDDDGLFEIRGETEFDAVGVDVEATGFAKRVFPSLATGAKIHELKLNDGVTIRGRLVKDGQPVAGAEMGLSGADRSSEIYAGNYSVATDQGGEFVFMNIPANTGYYVYGIMKSLGEKGAVSAQSIKTSEPESTLDLGELKLQPSYVVAGKIRMADEEPLPPNTRVFLSREEAWDSHQILADEEGAFRFEGVPAETVIVSSRVRGYRLTTKNAGLDPFNPFHLVGRVTTNKTDLILELEPGRDHERLDGDYHAARQEPLRGAEGGPRIGEIKITGTVTDAETGQPLDTFTVTEGRGDQYRQETINWFTTRKTPHTNGTFATHFTKQPQSPAVLIEAEGYAPHSSGAISVLETNLVIALRKGSGIEGILLKPDGTPAAAGIVYLTDMREGVYAQGPPLEVRDQMFRGTKTTETDDEGRFKFPAKIDAYSVIVIDDEGYAEVTVEDLAKKREVRLQPWAQVKGKLMIGSKPGAKETVRLGMVHVPTRAYLPRDHAALSLFLTTTTDDEGYYDFERVPPIAVQIYHEPKVRESRMGTIAVSQDTKMILEAGKTYEVILGGKGRPVIGKMVVDGHDGEIHWRADVHSIETILPEPEGLPDPRTFFASIQKKMQSARSDEERKEFSAEIQKVQQEYQRKQSEFYGSEAGRKHHFAKQRFALNFSNDGAFRIEDVPPGKYNLTMDLREATDDRMNHFSAPMIARLQKVIEVPDAPGGRSDDPHDLGTIEMTSTGGLKPGKAIPELVVKTLDDKSVKLSDYKGKFLLLDFWAPWNPTSIAEKSSLKETYEAFKNDERFAMLALSLDSREAILRDFVKTNQFGWTHGYVGDQDRMEAFTKFGVEQMPAIFLVGPDGKVVASKLRGPAIKSAVEAALKK